MDEILNLIESVSEDFPSYSALITISGILYVYVLHYDSYVICWKISSYGRKINLQIDARINQCVTKCKIDQTIITTSNVVSWITFRYGYSSIFVDN